MQCIVEICRVQLTVVSRVYFRIRKRHKLGPSDAHLHGRAAVLFRCSESCPSAERADLTWRGSRPLGPHTQHLCRRSTRLTASRCSADDGGSISPVHTSNNGEATLSNATSRTILLTKSNVASILLPFLATKSIVALTKSNVALTLLLVWTGLCCCFTSPIHAKCSLYFYFILARHAW